jgi:UDP-N-acetylmuramoyl-L-alanyl-D-glutamate--2,6-diaminopimelate ligase
MRLADLVPAELGASGLAGEDAAVEIADLAYDSRRVGPGALFFCVPGERSDGHDHAAQAVRAGAAALVVERPLGLGAPEVLVRSARAAMGPVAARFHGDPARELPVLGVTGTNGKTTTAYLMRALLEASGVQCGLLGTVKSVIGGEDRPVLRTTPEAVDLQADLRAMLEAGDGACAMEVSSHALTLERVAAIPFAAAVFTNLTQDHLDFHPTMEEYFLAKRRLFLPERGERPRRSVINLGDEYGRRLAREVPGALTYAVEGQADRSVEGAEHRVGGGFDRSVESRAGHRAEGPARRGLEGHADHGVEGEADYAARDLRLGPEGARFILRTPAGEQPLTLPMPGRFNVANALAALATVHSLGYPLDPLIEALEAGVRVPGRFEPVEEGQPFAVVVDYAHTPDSLENVLGTARELVRGHGRLICVFGAGGDRDRGKRPLMGEIAARLADEAIVTSDNPRSEDPEAIIEEIFAGIHEPRVAPRSACTAHGVADRRAAIGGAIAEGRPGDVVVIAGKGHEQGQELAGGRKIPFDDVSVAREALAARKSEEQPEVLTPSRRGERAGAQ